MTDSRIPPTAELKTKLDWALFMVALGFRVFPVEQNTKNKPLVRAWQYAASDKILRVTDWWSRWPDANIGVLTTGKLVLDVDIKKGKQGNISLFDLDIDLATFSVITPSGGRHLYYDEADVPCSVERLGSGLDVRSRNGYVLGPGSEIEGCSYVIEMNRPIAKAPEALVAQAGRGKDDSGRSDIPAAPLDTSAAIDRVTNFLGNEAPLAVEGNGGDLTTYKVAAAVKDIGVSQGTAVQLMLPWNDRCSPPWTPDDLREKIRNAYRYSVYPAGCATPEAAFGGISIFIPEDEAKTAALNYNRVFGRPFKYREPARLPPRRRLYRPHLTRGFISVTAAPGGVGKTSLTTVEALAVATGKPLLGVTPTERGPVWLWNGEDPHEETERRVVAAMLHYGLRADQVEGWLHLGSGRDEDLVLVTQERDGARVAGPVVEAMIRFIQSNRIALVVIDPFVSSHRVSENDNTAIDLVAKAWARIAQVANCAVHLVHHTRKTGGYDASVDDARGASALVNAARHARTLNCMDDEEAKRLGIDRLKRRSYFRVDDGKSNMSPPADAAEWFHLVSVALGNGDEFGNTDHVQVAVRWTPPDPSDGITPAVIRQVQELVAAGRPGGLGPWRGSIQAKDESWVGFAFAEILGLDLGDAMDEARAKSLIKSWTDRGYIQKVSRAINTKGNKVPCIEVGRWAGDDPPLSKGAGQGGG